MELGGGLGVVAYQGDFSGSLLSNQQPMLSIVGKYKINPRMALAMSLGYGHLKGTASDVDTYYPETAVGSDYSFNHALVDLGARYEYNFWPFGNGREYRGAKRLTPYIYIGAGLTVVKAKQTELALNLPVGGGVKYKVAERLNAALEWTIHFTTNDWLDGVGDPYGIKSSGAFKNTDCYSRLTVTLTYDLWAKCKTCHNDKD